VIPINEALFHQLQLLIGFIIIFYFLLTRSKVNIYVAILIVWTIIASIFTIASSNYNFLKNYVFEVINLVVPFFIYIIFSKNSITNKKTLFFGLIILSCCITIYYIAIFARFITVYARRSNLGYYIAYTNTLMSLIVLYSGEKSKKKQSKIFYYSAFIIYSFSVLYMGYFIALFVLIIGNFLLITLISCKNTKYFIKLIILLFIFIFSYFYDNLQTSIISKLSGTAYYVKINDISGLLYGNSEGSTLVARNEKYFISIEQIKRFPIFGAIWHYNQNSPILSVIGYHSFVLDTIALFGIPFGLACLYIVFWPFINKKRQLKDKNNKQFANILIIATLIIFIFDNEIPSIGFALLYCSFVCFENFNTD